MKCNIHFKNLISWHIYCFFCLSAAKLYVNESLTIPYTVSNAGSSQIDVVLTIEDDQSFTKDPKFRSHTLKVAENGTGSYVITAGSVAGVTRYKNSTFFQKYTKRKRITFRKHNHNCIFAFSASDFSRPLNQIGWYYRLNSTSTHVNIMYIYFYSP